MEWTWSSPLGISAVIISLGVLFLCFAAGVNLLARSGRGSAGDAFAEDDEGAR